VVVVATVVVATLMHNPRVVIESGSPENFVPGPQSTWSLQPSMPPLNWFTSW
jgi:hypothetical protein